jgi:putative addiction module killer protein
MSNILYIISNRVLNSPDAILMIRFLKKHYQLYKTPEYESWLSDQTDKEQAQIAERLSKIELEGYFGDHKVVSNHIWELKWKNGRRLYYAYLAELDLLLLLGGNKNGQDKDITKAKKIFRKHIES